MTWLRPRRITKRSPPRWRMARRKLPPGLPGYGRVKRWRTQSMFSSLMKPAKSLAYALAASQGARSLVLLGDPQQLDQPVKGVHPPGTDISALAHLLNGQTTIGSEQGLFLDETWRLHRDVCNFTSEVFYEGRLISRDENQSTKGECPRAVEWNRTAVCAPRALRKSKRVAGRG